ncbi:hypothetical protein ACHWQZ_G001620 [Mnemiopsis leidyi]
MACPYTSKRQSTVSVSEWKLAIRPDKSSECSWALGSSESSPHAHSKWQPPKKYGVIDNILDHIGNTPMVRLDRIKKEKGLKCDIFAKCEFFNAGGSVKDRIGKRMVEEAERTGRIKPGVHTLIEPTSGNTGIGLALAAAVKGYRCIIVMPEKMSNEKVSVLRALGAEIVRTPTSAAFDSQESHIAVSQKLLDEIPNSVILDQYRNEYNPIAHYDETAEEIYHQMDGKIDMIVVGAGTGGTVTGIARKLKEKIPNIKVVGVDPEGSSLAVPESLNEEREGEMYHVEGVGYDFIPTVLDRDCVDKWVKSEDGPSFAMSRQLIKLEGLLCGGSCGSNVYCAIEEAKDLPEGSRVVVILPDSVRNYMTKYLSDDWMIEHGFLSPSESDDMSLRWWGKLPVSVIEMKDPIIISPSMKCQTAMELMNNRNVDQLPVVDTDGSISGAITLHNMMRKVTKGQAAAQDPVSKVMYNQFQKVTVDTPLAEVSKMLDHDHFVIVTKGWQYYEDDGSPCPRDMYIGTITAAHLLSFIMSGPGLHIDGSSDL